MDVGKTAEETLTLTDDYVLEHVKMGLVTHESSAIAGFLMDGICGLGFKGIASVTIPSLVDSLEGTHMYTCTHTYMCSNVYICPNKYNILLL